MLSLRFTTHDPKPTWGAVRAALAEPRADLQVIPYSMRQARVLQFAPYQFPPQTCPNQG
jgi:hypothetical protein